MADYTMFNHGGGGQTPETNNNSSPAGPYTLGIRFTAPVAGYQATFLHYYLPAGGLAVNTTVLAQLWDATTSTRLVEIDLKSAAVSGYVPVSGWMSVPVPSPPTLDTTHTYITCAFSTGSPGQYCYTSSSFAVYPLGSTPGPVGSTGIFDTGTTHDSIPTTTNPGYFWSDVTLSQAVTGVAVTGTGVAAGAGAAFNPAASVAPNAGVGTGAGAGFGAAGQVAASGGGAASSGAAGSAAALLSTSAGVAAGGGAALGAAGQVSSGAGGAAASGDAGAAAAGLSTGAGVGAGAGDAFNASVRVGLSAGVGAAAGQAFRPTITGTDIISPVTSTYFGPCEWEYVSCGAWPTGSEAVTGTALRAATETLWQATGQRYGLCTYTIRPCRRDCYGMAGYGFPFWGSQWWEWSGATWPQPYLYAGNWYNLTCNNSCGDTCSCFTLEETWLPSPVADVIEVKIDGTVMPTGSYKVQDYRKLVRTDGGMWPFCQDMSLPDTETNTWSITVQVGEQVPYIGQMSLGELSREYARACMGMDCALPTNLQSLARQGISISFPSDATFLQKLPLTKEFLGYANPNHLYAKPTVADIDGPKWRRDTWP